MKARTRKKAKVSTRTKVKKSARNNAAGNAKIVKGSAKVVLGKITRNRLLQIKGEAEKIIGRLQKSVAARQKSKGK